ncbi:MAG: DUF378 domain-containing protein [Patescibacteria group bacterium]|nr:DUF378 domain-containing protein [Patescibacteria group bacterium]
MNRLNVVDWIALILLIIGGLNWGSIGLFDFNFIAAIFGVLSAVTRIIYILVGISAVYIAIVGPSWGRHRNG